MLRKLFFNPSHCLPVFSTKNQGGLTHWLGKPLIKQVTESANLSTLALTVEIKESKSVLSMDCHFSPMKL